MNFNSLIMLLEDVNDLTFIESIVKKIGNYSKLKARKPTGNQNCQLTCWAFEAQLRGMNILPRPVYSPRDVSLSLEGIPCVHNKKKIYFSNLKDLYDMVDSYENGARFYIHFKWESGFGGHESYILKINDKLYAVNPQDGEMAQFKKENKKYPLNFPKINFEDSYAIRTDKSKIDYKILKYNSMKYFTPWNEKKDIEYMKKQGWIK